MKVIQFNAISSDGFIATKDGDSEWVSDVDTQLFEAKIKEIDCIVMGRKTFDQYHGELYPFKDVLNIVVTSDALKRQEDETVFVGSPSEAVKIAEEKGFKEILLIGGGTINGSFIKEGLVDEVFLDVHPLILGEGINLFEGYKGNTKLKLVESKNLEKGQVLLHYQVTK